MKAAGSILIVDDEDSVRRVVHTALDAFGYERVLEANEAGRALEIARQYRRPIQLLISDIDLGGNVDGIQLARLIAAIRPDVKVLLMSGRPDPSFELDPGWRFIAKPFTASDLLGAVRRSLEAGAVQFRQAVADLAVFTLDLKKKIIPAGATLEDFRIGPGHQGLLPHHSNIASFHYAGDVYFNLAHEFIGKTKIVGRSKHLHAA